MPYSFLPLFLILLGLAIISVVLFRHIPQISSLDVDELPEEQQARTKKAIVEKQFTASLKRQQVVLMRILTPLGVGWKWLQNKFRDSVSRTYVNYAKTKATMKVEPVEAPPPEALAALLKDAETAAITGSWDEAEQKFIEVIRMAPRNIEAYRGLARLYFERQEWREAAELYLFILRLDPQDVRALNRLGMIASHEEKWNDAARYFKRAVDLDSNVAIRHFDLGTAYRELEKHLDALASFERAVSLEPHNPKYLDAYLEEAIAMGNKELALQVLGQLQLANPENKKLDELNRRIEEL